MPLENMPAFIARLTSLSEKTTGTAIKKSPGSGPKATIAKGGKAKAQQKEKKKPKEKKEPPAPKTMEDLDAELLNYTAARASEGAAPAEVEPVPAS